MERTLCGDIGKSEGKGVTLKGWVDGRRDHGGLIFIDLRDRSGIAQIVFNPKKHPEAHRTAESLRTAYVVKITGEVGKRPKGMENPKIPSGDWEVSAKELEIINEAETPPLSTDDDGYDIGEETRMKYRYLDLRRPRLRKNLKNRARVINFIRQWLTQRDFTEIETPVLGKSTPEGARDYLVPSRIYPGSFYALPQSPQQYKQLLMVAGLERYFQIARCFRDEDTRGDRQPEFTQLDLEMSFTDQEEILGLTEELFTSLVEELYPAKKITKKPFPRITYKEVMEKYGSDRPDLRKDKNDPNELAFAFVVDFPMFEKKDDGTYGVVHHPFTQPQVKSADELKKSFKKNPLGILAHQYDLVLNGSEVGGGSIRTHDPALLQAVFEALGNEPEKIRKDFGHILEAFEYGVPPHGGIAPGLDRLIMILENEPNIREVIAFPKTGDGRDLLMGAPSEVDKEQLNELGLEIKKKKK
ncbi:MAG: aspartate--tRNA ligase [Candidatus Jorgensenbacteria bacterium]